MAPECGTAQGLIHAERLREVVWSQPITLKDAHARGKAVDYSDLSARRSSRDGASSTAYRSRESTAEFA